MNIARQDNSTRIIARFEFESGSDLSKENSVCCNAALFCSPDVRQLLSQLPIVYIIVYPRPHRLFRIQIDDEGLSDFIAQLNV